MNRRIVLGCAAAAMLISSLFLVAGGRAADEKKPGGEFDGQFLAIFHKVASGSTYLSKVEVKTLGEHTFLVGSRLELDDPKQGHGAEVLWVSLDDVSGIMPFPTFERLKDYFGPKK